MSKSRIAIAVIVASCLAIVCTKYVRSPATAQSAISAVAADDRNSRPVSSIVTPVQVVRGMGYVEPESELRKLVFKVDGVIDALAVEVGQRVAEGTILATLKNQDEAALLAEAEQVHSVALAERDQFLAGIHPERISAARKMVELFDEQLRHATKHHHRIEELAVRNATTTQDRDRAETELRQAETEVSHAQAELASLEHHVRLEDRRVYDARIALTKARVEVARQRFENTILRAPMDGTVMEILKREGEGARLLDTEPVLIFADESRLRVRAEIDERYVHHLAAGQRAEAYGRGLGNTRHLGSVRMVKQLMGNKTVFSHSASERKDLDIVQVLVDLPPGFRAPLGLQVDIDIYVEPGAQPGSVALPQSHAAAHK